ncbi:MAG: T9SS type A sorting domain-containing protein, partial [Bacteroidetes bacterium]|nr:T9SS type A sorting domain-containing protein [Bacteroidota bacterium]
GMVKIYPNPFSDFSNIQIEDFANYKKGNPVFIVYDLFGTMYKEVNLSSENTIFIKGELASGLYFFEVVYDKKVIQRGKLICQ